VRDYCELNFKHQGGAVRVLLVEDDGSVAESLRRGLKRYGFEEDAGLSVKREATTMAMLLSDGDTASCQALAQLAHGYAPVRCANSTAWQASSATAT